MATHSNVLAWRILGTAEPGGLPSTGSYRVGHDCSDLAAAAAEGGPRNLQTAKAKKIRNMSFPMSWPFAVGDQSIGASASASVLPMNIQG